MKTMCLKTITSMAFTAMLALTMQSSVFAQNTNNDQEDSASGKLQGFWDVTVTVHRCDTGQAIGTLRYMNLFNQGGTIVGAPDSGAALRGPTLGTWRHLDGQRYSAVIRFFIYKPDGSFDGMQRTTRLIEISADANEFTAQSIAQTFDANGVLIFQAACPATEVAKRFQ